MKKDRKRLFKPFGCAINIRFIFILFNKMGWSIMNNSDFKKIVKTYKAKYGILSKGIPEIIAVRFGLKKATTIIYPPDGAEFERAYSRIQNFCLKTGLHAGYYKIKGDEYKIILSKEKLNLTNGELITNQNRDNWEALCGR